MSEIYCFDACALVTFLKNENGADMVEDILSKAADDKAKIYMSFINLIEVGYIYMREKTQIEYSALWPRIEAMPIEIIRTISEPVFFEAIRLKAVYRKISLADSVGLATEKSLTPRLSLLIIMSLNLSLNLNLSPFCGCRRILSDLGHRRLLKITHAKAQRRKVVA